MPTNLTPQVVRKSWDDLIDSGELILGEPCSPYTITRYSTKEEKTTANEITVCGQKVPLATLRDKLLKKHMKYMRLLDNQAFAHVTREQLLTAVYKVDHTVLTPLRQMSCKPYWQKPKEDDIWHYGITMLPSSALGFS